MTLWEVKPNVSGEYIPMKTPSEFTLSGQDLDNNSYRSITTGNINRTIVGKKWQSAKLVFNYLTESDIEQIMPVLNYYPMYVRFKSPIFSSNGMWEGQCYCAEFKVDMQQNKETGATWSNLTFTLVQGKKVANQ